jgi:hypothetical protein
MVCIGSTATINLAGLLASSTSTVNYSINGVAQTAVTGVVANSSGVASFTSAALTAANNGQTLQITGITVTSATPNCTASFTQNVTLSVDTADPTFTFCPGNQTDNSNHTGCTYQESGTGWDAIATDNNGTTTLAYNLSGVTSGSGNFLSGVQFNAGVTTVTWTATDGCGRTAHCIYTVTVSNILANVTLQSGDNECPELKSSQGFKSDNGDYSLGATKVVFRVERQNSSTSTWSFNYNVSGATVYGSSPHPSSGTINLTGSDNFIDLDFLITNVENSPLTVTLNVTSISDANGCNDTTTRSAQVNIKAMPKVGSFN